jgi:hypothetical protein
MAETTPAANNKSISFGRKVEREMTEPNDHPVKAAVKKTKTLAPHLRKKAKQAIKRGMISAKAAKKHLGEV